MLTVRQMRILGLEIVFGGVLGQGPREREPPLPQIVPCRHPVGCYWDSPRPECNGSSLSQAIRLLDHRLTPAR
jgi:hypothetical protein